MWPLIGLAAIGLVRLLIWWDEANDPNRCSRCGKYVDPENQVWHDGRMYGPGCARRMGL